LWKNNGKKKLGGLVALGGWGDDNLMLLDSSVKTDQVNDILIRLGLS